VAACNQAASQAGNAGSGAEAPIPAELVVLRQVAANPQPAVQCTPQQQADEGGGIASGERNGERIVNRSARQEESPAVAAVVRYPRRVLFLQKR